MTPELARLIAGHVFLHACMAGMRLAAPLLALRLGYSAGAVGLLLALFALMQVFLALPAGRFVDKHGLRRPLGIAVVTASAGSLLAVAYGLLPTFAVLCIAALCTGGATGAAVIALQRHVGRAAQTPLALKKVFSWLSLGPAFSNFIGPFMAGVLIDYFGFRTAFACLALLPLLAWLCVRRTADLPSEAVTRTSQTGARAAENTAAETLTQAANKAATKTATKTPRAWDLLREPMFRRLLLVNWFLSACWDVHTFVVPILGHERGLSASSIGGILGAFAVAATVVRLILPLLAARVQEWAVIVSAMLATTVLFAAYPFLAGPLQMGACSVLLGLALGSVQPMVMSMLHQITPPARHGEALGLRLMAINASSVSMPLLFGATGAVVGVSVVFWVMAAVLGVGTRLAFGLKEAGPLAAGSENPH